MRYFKEQKLVGFLCVLSFFVAVMFPADVRAEDEKGDIVIGGLLPETGTTSWVKVAYAGIDLAIKQVNDAGGPLGRKMSYIKRDTESSSELTRQRAQELVDSGVVAIVGPTSHEVFVATEVAQKAGVTIISPTAGTTKLDDVENRWVLRTTSSDKILALAMSVESLIMGFKRAAVLCANTGSGTSIADALDKAFVKVGGQIVERVIFEEGKASYREELQKIADKAPEMIFWEASPKEAATIFRERAELGIAGLWMGTDYMNEEFVKKVSAEVTINGLIGMVPSPAPGVRLDEWKKELKALTGADGVPAFSAQAYDAVNIIALAIEAAGSADRKKLHAKLFEVANSPGVEVKTFAEGIQYLREGKDIDYTGIAGSADFDKYGDVIVDHIVRQVKKGELVQVGVLTQEELSQYIK